MRRLASPSLTPTSQVQGDATGNAEAMAPGPHADIPLSSPRPQPTTAVEHQPGTWVPTPSAGTA